MNLNPSLALLAGGNPKLLEALQDPGLLQKCLQNPNYLGELLQGHVAGATQQPTSTSTPPAQQSPQAPPASAQERMLLDLLREFVESGDEGRQLAANLGKFARFVQSKVNAPATQGQ